MTDRLLDFSQNPASLSFENGLLVIRAPEMSKQTVPVAEIAAVITSHRQVVFTQALVAELGKAGAILVCCDERHHPAAMMLPIASHFKQTERFHLQAAASAPTKKRVWQELVRAKIAAQARTLRAVRNDDAGLGALSKRVRSGDAGNLEAVAALRYWPRIFGDPDFRRGNDEDGRNSLLNYGYTVLRAVTARAVCAAGLHPSFGVAHANHYNPFCLADDLMEPLRPLLDLHIARWFCDSEPVQWKLTQTVKLMLLSSLAARYTVQGERRTIFDILGRRAQGLASIFMGTERSFRWDEVEPED